MKYDVFTITDISISCSPFSLVLCSFWITLFLINETVLYEIVPFSKCKIQINGKLYQWSLQKKINRLGYLFPNHRNQYDSNFNLPNLLTIYQLEEISTITIRIPFQITCLQVCLVRYQWREETSTEQLVEHRERRISKFPLERNTSAENEKEQGGNGWMCSRRADKNSRFP